MNACSNAGAYGVNDRQFGALHIQRQDGTRVHLAIQDAEALLRMGEASLARHIPFDARSRRGSWPGISVRACAPTPRTTASSSNMSANELKKAAGLYLTGDYMQGASIEACFRSASACVKHLAGTGINRSLSGVAASRIAIDTGKGEDSMSSYYLGDNATNYIPFDDLQTIQHFIVPNFATMNWDKFGHQNALNNLSRLNDDNNAVNEDIMIYIHIPYCLSMCHYCNFNRFSFPFRNEDALSTYVDYVDQGTGLLPRLPYVQSRKLTAVYFGGGSPSVLPPAMPRRVSLNILRRVIPNWNTIEKTFTGEPRTLKKPELLQLLVDYGFNRVTFGVESFNEEIRKQIGRWDTLQDVAEVFTGLEKVGYKGEKDLDLMFDLPGQTFEGFQKELDIMIRDFRPDELDAYGTVYLPYRALHKMIVQEKRPQPGTVWQLLQMREYLYDFMSGHGYHNTIAETWSRKRREHSTRPRIALARTSSESGAGARSNFKDMVSINPEKVDRWMKNIDEYGVSTENLQSIGREGVLERIMVMFPRYKEITKAYLDEFRDVRSFDTMTNILEKHIAAGVVEEHPDRYTVNKLGVLWICNLQTDYMQPSFNMLGKVLTKVLSEKRKNFDNEARFKVNPLTQFIANNIDRYPKLMK